MNLTVQIATDSHFCSRLLRHCSRLTPPAADEPRIPGPARHRMEARSCIRARVSVQQRCQT